MTYSGQIAVEFDVTKVSDKVYVVVLQFFREGHVYREKEGAVYVGARGSELVHPHSIVAKLVREIVAIVKRRA